MRKPIQKELCTEVGFVKKTHGLKGDVMISFEEGMEDLFDAVEMIYLEIEGLLVPFFIEELMFRSTINANVKFESIETQEKAKLFVGCKIFVDTDEIEIDELISNPTLLKGYFLLDQSIGAIGSVLDVENFNSNFVLTVSYQGREVLIPLNEELIVSLDEERQTLIMNCPEGLLDINED